MIIPKEIRQLWGTLSIKGDQKKMANDDETLRRYISVAMNGGFCSEETFITIRDFYNARIELLNTALPDEQRINTIQSAKAPAVGSVSH